MTVNLEEEFDIDDPIRARASSSVHFRADDPPEVREALLEEAIRQDRTFFRDALERRGVSDAKD